MLVLKMNVASNDLLFSCCMVLVIFGRFEKEWGGAWDWCMSVYFWSTDSDYGCMAECMKVYGYTLKVYTFV